MTSRRRPAQENLPANGHTPKDEKQKDATKLHLAKKVFTFRNSVLTDLMEIKHLQSVYNIGVAVCGLLFINLSLYYLADPSKFWYDVNAVKWGASKFSYFVVLWIILNLYAYSKYEEVKFWIFCRNRINAKIIDALFLLLFLCSFTLMYIATTYAALYIRFPPISGFALMCEQVRISMKIYSFVMENASRVRQYKPHKDDDQKPPLDSYPSRKHFFYFLFAPTLIYRDSYPRTQSINWGNVFRNFMKFISVIFITFCILMRFNQDVFKNVGFEQITRSQAALILGAGATATGASLMFLMFYGILHCWQNFMAELLKFGDKEFYQDWWNSTSFSQYYRKMNTIVYDWLYAYIYVEAQKAGISKTVAMVLVFIISAFVHEYIICIAIGFFYPVLCLSYTTAGMFALFLTKQRTGQFWNIYMWGMLFAGWGVVISLYSIEWYARINCPKQETTLDFFIPRTFDPSCHIFNFLKT